MLDYPPKCSPQWTVEERIRLVEWIARILYERIQLDGPHMPVVRKQPVQDILYCIGVIANRSAEVLEANREALEKPYDTDKNFHASWIVGDPRIVAEACGSI